nr:immunoglobulin heavy chain junction region [Macaca mulatta]
CVRDVFGSGFDYW